MARVITAEITQSVEDALLTDGPQTRRALGLTPYQCRLLLAEKVIRRDKSDERTGNRGRPGHRFRLTDAARKRARRRAAA